jgi:WbqC-like protein
MKVAIHQPQYLPWLGYLAKWAAADVFVFLDTVQYEKNGWQNRNRIRTAAGAHWLTVPVHAHLGTPIAEVSVDTTQPWRARHLRAIEHAYTRAPHLAAYQPGLHDLLDREWDRLAPVAVASAEWLARAVGVTTPTRLASSLAADDGDATGRLVSICKSLGADTYLAGGHGARYMDTERFREAGITVLYQRYEHPVYPQQHGEFMPFLSGVDLLLTHGDESLPILRRGDAWSREG